MTERFTTAYSQLPTPCFARAGSSTVREHSADIRATVVRLHLGLLAAIRRERERPLQRASGRPTRLKRTHPTDN